MTAPPVPGTPSDLPPARTLLARALRRRCPSCGGGPLFSYWTKMVSECPSCHLTLQQRESGYTLGGLWLNLLFAELVTATIFVGVIILTWPNPPWQRLQYGLPVLALCTPIFFFPFSKTLFLALDLVFRGRDGRS